MINAPKRPIRSVTAWSLAVASLLIAIPRHVSADGPAKDVAGTAAAGETVTASAENEGAVIDISIPKSCKLGQPAKMVVTIRNNGDSPFYCMEMLGLPNCGMTMQLRDARTNDAVEMTQHGRDTFRQFTIGGSVGLDRLDKGMHRSWTIDLGDFFELRRGNLKFGATFRLNRHRNEKGQSAYINVAVKGPDFGVSD